MLERWTLDFSLRSQQSGAPQPPPAVRLDTPAVYKRMVIALRSLYSYVRVLPAYRLSAACRVRFPPSHTCCVLPILAHVSREQGVTCCLAAIQCAMRAASACLCRQQRSRRHSDKLPQGASCHAAARWRRQLQHALPHRAGAVAGRAIRRLRQTAGLCLCADRYARRRLPDGSQPPGQSSGQPMVPQQLMSFKAAV